MIKKVIQNALINLKLYYFDIFIIFLPFYLVYFMIPRILLVSELNSPVINALNSLIKILSVSCILFFYGIFFSFSLFYVKNRLNNKKLIQIFCDFKTGIKYYLIVILKKSFILGVGFLLFFIPGIIVFIKWYLVYPFMLFEKSKDPFIESSKFGKKNRILLLSIFCIFVLFFFFSYVFGRFFQEILLEIVKIPPSKKTIYFGAFFFNLLITPFIVLFDFELFKFAIEKSQE